MNNYSDFINNKRRAHQPSGFGAPAPLPEILFPFQRAMVERSLALGRSAIFADCGLGKTFMQLAWGNQVWAKTHKPVLIVAPLVVAEQTSREAIKCHYTCRRVKEMSNVKPKHGMFITNYERIEKFDASEFGGIVLDESSILKSTDGRTRTALIEQFRRVPYKLACTATPAPNDVMELGNHAEFLGVMTQAEMLSMYFVHDGGETQKWRLKGHARGEFWRWVGSWSTMARHPRDIGFESKGYDLPPLTLKEIVVQSAASDGMLIPLPASTLGERLSAYRNSMAQRIDAVAKLCNGNNEQWVIWCRLNDESEAVTKAIDGAVEITGSDDEEDKASRMMEFADKKIRVIVSKSKIAGFGVNWQNCHNVVFAGVTDSFEQYYQAVRRCWRFGQDKPVNVYVIGSESETAVFQNLKRKQTDTEFMASEMVKIIKESSK